MVRSDFKLLFLSLFLSVLKEYCIFGNLCWLKLPNFLDQHIQLRGLIRCVVGFAIYPKWYCFGLSANSNCSKKLKLLMKSAWNTTFKSDKWNVHTVHTFIIELCGSKLTWTKNKMFSSSNSNHFESTKAMGKTLFSACIRALNDDAKAWCAVGRWRHHSTWFARAFPDNEGLKTKWHTNKDQRILPTWGEDWIIAVRLKASENPCPSRFQMRVYESSTPSANHPLRPRGSYTDTCIKRRSTDDIRWPTYRITCLRYSVLILQFRMHTPLKLNMQPETDIFRSSGISSSIWVHF